MKKRILSIILSVFIMLSVMPLSAFAEDDTIPYLEFFGKLITNKNTSAYFSDTLHPDATFDPETYTLTLKRSITLSSAPALGNFRWVKNEGGADVYAMIYAREGLKGKTLTIKAESINFALEQKCDGPYENTNDYGNYAFMGINAPDTDIIIDGSYSVTIDTPREAVICKNLTINTSTKFSSSYSAAIEVSETITVNDYLGIKSSDGGKFTDGFAVSAKNIYVSESAEARAKLDTSSIDSFSKRTEVSDHKTYVIKAENITVNGELIANNCLTESGFKTVATDKEGTEYVSGMAINNIVFGIYCTSCLTVGNNGRASEYLFCNKDFSMSDNNISAYGFSGASLVFDNGGTFIYHNMDYFRPEITIKGPYNLSENVNKTGDFLSSGEYEFPTRKLSTEPFTATDLYIRSNDGTPQYCYASHFGDNSDIKVAIDFSESDFTTLLRDHKNYKIHIISGDFTAALSALDSGTLPEISLEGGSVTLKGQNDNGAFEQFVINKKISIGESSALYLDAKRLIISGLDIDGSGKLYCVSGNTTGKVAEDIKLYITDGNHNLDYNGLEYEGKAILSEERGYFVTGEKTTYTIVAEQSADWSSYYAYVLGTGEAELYYTYASILPDSNNQIYLWLPQYYKKDVILKVRSIKSGSDSYKLYVADGGKLQSDGTYHLVEQDFIVDDLDCGDKNYTIGDSLNIIGDGVYEDCNSFPTDGSNITFEWYLKDKSGNATKVSTLAKYVLCDSTLSPGDYTLTREVFYKGATHIRTDTWQLHAVRITQPKNTHAVAGNDCTFTVDFDYSSSGYSQSSLKWQVNTGDGFVDIDNASSKSYTVTGITEDNIDELCTYKYRAVAVYKNSDGNERTFYSTEACLYTLSLDKHTYKNYIGIGEEYTMTAFESSELREGYTVEWTYTDSRDNTVHKVECDKLSYTKTITADDDYLDYTCTVFYNGVPAGKNTFRICVVKLIQPKSQVADLNEQVTFTADYEKMRSDHNATYSWWVDKGDGNGYTRIKFEESNTYTFTVTDEAIYTYKYRMCLTSNTLTASGIDRGDFYTEEVSVLRAPAIKEQPQNMTVHISDPKTYSFTVKAEGADTYMWQVKNGDNWENLSGETAESLSFTGMSDELNGTQYRCALTNRLGTTYSNEVTLTVKYPPKISESPADLAVFTGSSASFSVGNFSIPADEVELYWQQSADGGKTWTDIKKESADKNISITNGKTAQIIFGKVDLETGETIQAPSEEAPTYILSMLSIEKATEDMDGYLFRCAVKDEFDIVTTAAARLCVCEEVTKNSDGEYEIGTASQLMWFSLKFAKSSDAAQNARLIANINAQELGNFTIGSESKPYSGTFDGNGYTLTVKMDSTEKYAAPFAFAKDAAFKNLNISGTIKTSKKFASSIVGYAYSGTVTVEKCLSSVIIDSTVDGDGTHGGLIARSGAKVIVNNCGFTGAINGKLTDACGGLVGYTHNYGSTEINNSFVSASFTVGENRSNTFVRNDDDAVINNCYYLNELNETHGAAIKKSADAFASGEVAYLLQKENGDALVWGQTTSIDGATPILTTNEEYRVLPVKSGETIVNYSVLHMGDVNNSGEVDIYDYQQLVNIALSESNAKKETEKYDLNGDGVFDVLDCAIAERKGMSEDEYKKLVQKALDSEPAYREKADFDGDGVVDVLDASSLERMLSGHRMRLSAQVKS